MYNTKLTYRFALIECIILARHDVVVFILSKYSRADQKDLQSRKRKKRRIFDKKHLTLPSGKYPIDENSSTEYIDVLTASHASGALLLL